MPAPTNQKCQNCGEEVSSKFCPECGQSTSVSIPTLPILFTEAFAAVISYDSRFLRTLRVLTTQPGELTAAFLRGERVRYLSPFQLFIWLQALTFLVNRLMFDTDSKISDLKSRDLLIIGVSVALLMAAMNAPKRHRVIESVVFVAHLWSFLMFALLFEYLILPVLALAINTLAPHFHFQMGLTATLVAMVAMLIYTPIGLTKVFKDSPWLVGLKIVLMLLLYYGLEVFFTSVLHPNIQV